MDAEALIRAVRAEAARLLLDHDTKRGVARDAQRRFLWWLRPSVFAEAFSAAAQADALEMQWLSMDRLVERLSLAAAAEERRDAAGRKG